MTNKFGVDAIYVGERDNMIAEVSAFDPREIGVKTKDCKWLVTPIGVHDYDTDWLSTKKEALKTARILADELGVEVRGV